MDNVVDVRRLAASDVSELARVLLAFMPSSHDQLNRDGYLAHVRQALTSEQCYVFAAFRGTAPLGYVMAYRFPRFDTVGDQVYIFDVEVLAGSRGQGVGRHLMEALLRACWTKGVTWAWAGTARDNIAAQRLFERAGAERVSETYVEYHFHPPDA